VLGIGIFALLLTDPSVPSPAEAAILVAPFAFSVSVYGSVGTTAKVLVDVELVVEIESTLVFTL
jgi:hypothetical protein